MLVMKVNFDTGISEKYTYHDTCIGNIVKFFINGNWCDYIVVERMEDGSEIWVEKLFKEIFPF